MKQTFLIFMILVNWEITFSQELSQQDIIQLTTNKGEQFIADTSTRIRVFSFIDIDKQSVKTPAASLWTYKNYIYLDCDSIRVDSKYYNLRIIGKIINQKRYRQYYIFQLKTTTGHPVTMYFDKYQYLTIIKEDILCKLLFTPKK